jgi:hypothetical protein
MVGSKGLSNSSGSCYEIAMTITLTLEQEAWLKAHVAHGDFSSIEEAARQLIDERMAGHPESGPPRPALGPNIRIGIFSPYIVIYRYIEADSAPHCSRHRKTARKLLIC